MSMIVPLVVGRIVRDLTQACITDIDEDDPTRADIVKAGRFQEDPVFSNIHVSVSGGDPEDPKYKDGIVTLEDMDNAGLRFPPREIGGGQLWWRRGICQVGCYFINEQFDELTATDYAYTVLSRVQETLKNVFVNDLVDTNGEQALKLFSYGNTFFESGGPPASYIWRGKVYWSCLTERP